MRGLLIARASKGVFLEALHHLAPADWTGTRALLACRADGQLVCFENTQVGPIPEDARRNQLPAAARHAGAPRGPSRVVRVRTCVACLNSGAVQTRQHGALSRGTAERLCPAPCPLPTDQTLFVQACRCWTGLRSPVSGCSKVRGKLCTPTPLDVSSSIEARLAATWR